MPADFSDDQVAAILAQEAKDASIKYSAMGLSAFMPARAPINKPKPNTRFLRNLVRDTDSHNAALLAKEAADSKARLEQLVTKGSRPDHDIRRRQLGNITAVLSANASGKRRAHDTAWPEHSRRASPSNQDKYERSGRGRRDDSLRDLERRHDREARGRSREGNDSGHEANKADCEQSSSRRRHERGTNMGRGTRSRSPRREEGGSARRRERSPAGRQRDDTERRRCDAEYRIRRPEGRKHLAPPDDDFDPLEEIVGPLPPQKVQARGRGSMQASSGIDARFLETYDPALDLTAGEGEVGDDWDMVLDRVKWRQQGAERLRAAGFTDKEVEGWQSGRQAEVRWAKSGEGREWDRGKDQDS